MGHCPWLGIYLGYVPFAARLMKKLLDYGEERSMERIKNGSLARDLFYYLVRLTSVNIPVVILTFIGRIMKMGWRKRLPRSLQSRSMGHSQ